MVDIAEYPFSLEYANNPAFKQLDYDWPIVYLIKWERYVYIWETYNPYNVNKIDDEEIDDTIYKMYNYYENFQMIGGHQWRDAILISEQKYRLKTIHSLIDEVYEEYKLLNKLGISRSKSKKEMLKDWEVDDLVTIRRKQILEGRKILGEPEDFNF